MGQLFLILITWGLLFGLAVYSAPTSSLAAAPTSSPKQSPAQPSGGTTGNKKDNKVWLRTYGSASDDYAPSITPGFNGGYFIGGNSWVESKGGHMPVALVRKIDRDGGLVWEKRFLVDSTLGHVAARPDGGVLAAGTLQGNVWIVALDLNGSVIWQNDYGPGEVTKIVSAVDGGYIVVVSRFGKLLVLHISEEGDVVWSREYNQGQGLAIVRNSEGGYSLTGMSGEFIDEGDDANIFLMGIDQDGEVTRSVEYRAKGPQYGYGLARLPDGGFVITGFTASGVQAGRSDALIMRVDKSGGLKWVKTVGGSSSNIFRSLSLLPNDRYLAIGTRRDLFWAVTFKSNGQTVSQWNLGKDKTKRSWVQDGMDIIFGPDGDYAVLARVFRSTPPQQNDVAVMRLTGSEEKASSIGGFAKSPGNGRVGSLKLTATPFEITAVESEIMSKPTVVKPVDGIIDPRIIK